MIHLLLAVIYLSFISLGLPDSLLGAAWPSMYPDFGVPVSYSGVIFCIISVGTVISSLQSDRLTRRLGTGWVTAISVGMTAAALFSFSVSHSFWALCLWAIPYGLGVGLIALGVAAMLLPLGETVTLAGLLLIGLGCAPIYPSIIHSTPAHFGADKSQAIIGVQMASAYIGNCLMPPLFGLIANRTTISIFPYYLLVILMVMGYMHEVLEKETREARQYES